MKIDYLRKRVLGTIPTLSRQILHVALIALIVIPALVMPAMAQGPEEVNFKQIITTPSGTGLGGSVDLTLRSDGTYKAHFHMHNRNGLVDYSFVVRAVFAATNGTSFAWQHSGEVEGTESTTLTQGPRRNSYKDITGFHQLIKANWQAVKAGRMSVGKDYSRSGVTGFIEDLAQTVIDLTKGAARGAVGAVIGLGDEMVKTFESLEQSGTIGVIAGVAVIASGGGLVLAVTTGVQAGLMTKALIKNRPVTEAEYKFANWVFKGTLPPRENIILTNLEGLGGRAFVMPGIGSKTYVNIGAYPYDHPLTHVSYADDTPGRLFIHELTHVWQIHWKTFVPGWVCEGLIDQAGNTFTDAYEYESKGFIPWSEFNIEQQASLVADWFRRRMARAVAEMNPEDPTDGYFRYIRDDVRSKVGAVISTFPSTPTGPQPTYSGTFDTGGGADEFQTLYTVSQDGTLTWRRHYIRYPDGRNNFPKHTFSEPKTVGSGWAAGHKAVMAMGQLGIYSLRDDGTLRWNWHLGFNDGSFRWLDSVELGKGLSGFTELIAQDEGIIYGRIQNDPGIFWGVTTNYDKKKGQPSTSIGLRLSPPNINFAAFTKVFSGGKGVFYGVDRAGKLYWMRHNFYLSPMPDPVTRMPGDPKFQVWLNQWSGPVLIGSGVGSPDQIFSPGNGHIYYVFSNTLIWRRHDGWENGTNKWNRDSWTSISLGTNDAWSNYKFVFARNTTSDLGSGNPLIDVIVK